MAVLEAMTVALRLTDAAFRNDGYYPTLVIVGADSWRTWVAEGTVADEVRFLRGIPVRLSDHVESYQIIW